jgi:hypothetical protein
MSTRALPRPRTWPTFGPLLILETVPWLMLAAALRIVAYRGGLVALLAYVAASVATFLAILLATRRIIEAADGQTNLGTLAFRAQLTLARRVLWQVFALMIGTYLALKFAGLPTSVAKHALAGFDGIAFDQFTVLGRLWSAVLAALVFLAILRADQGHGPSLIGAGRELLQRWSWLVVLFWQTDAMPELKRVVFFSFIVVFASLRLWLTLAILTFALRASYRAQAPLRPEAERI